VADVVRNIVNEEKSIALAERVSMKEFGLGFSQKGFEVVL